MIFTIKNQQQTTGGAPQHAATSSTTVGLTFWFADCSSNILRIRMIDNSTRINRFKIPGELLLVNTAGFSPAVSHPKQVRLCDPPHKNYRQPGRHG